MVKKITDLHILPSDVAKLMCTSEVLGRMTEEELEKVLGHVGMELQERELKYDNRNH